MAHAHLSDRTHHSSSSLRRPLAHRIDLNRLTFMGQQTILRCGAVAGWPHCSTCHGVPRSSLTIQVQPVMWIWDVEIDTYTILSTERA